jgi:hypothetical protein
MRGQVFAEILATGGTITAALGLVHTWRKDRGQKLSMIEVIAFLPDSSNEITAFPSRRTADDVVLEIHNASGSILRLEVVGISKKPAWRWRKQQVSSTGRRLPCNLGPGSTARLCISKELFEKNKRYVVWARFHTGTVRKCAKPLRMQAERAGH